MGPRAGLDGRIISAPLGFDSGPSSPWPVTILTELPGRHDKELDIDTKLNRCFKLTGIIRNMFRPQKTGKKTRINVHNTAILPALLHSCENWTIKTTDSGK